MSVPLSDVMKALLTDEERADVDARVQQMIEEEKTLRDLRSAQQLTQARVAELLGVQQDSVSRMERRTDMLLSTMSSYVEAMGGKLRLVAEFPDRKPFTVRLSDLSKESERPKRRKVAAKAKSKTVAPKSKPKSQTASKSRAKAA